MMSPTLYRITVMTGVLAWASFGLSLGMVLSALDAGEPRSNLQIGITCIWFVMGVGDVWWLFRYGMARPTKGSDRAESVV